MASLTNCQEVISYTAEEFAGDTPTGVNTLELQQPPTGASETDPTSHMYYLVIEAMPEYRVNHSMINIGGVSGASSWAGTPASIYAATSPDATIQAVVPTYVNNIAIYNSLPDDPDSCDNKVIIQVNLSTTFVMPASDYTISIDLGGVAVECVPDIPNFVPGGTPTGEELVGPALEAYIQRLYVTNYSSESGYDIFFAQYYDSESYASSVYNLHNWLDYINSDSELPVYHPPPYDWNDNFYQTSFPYAWSDGCLDSFQPTCYTRYNGGGNEDGGFFDDTTTDAPNVISTTCGQLLIGGNLNSMETQNDPFGGVSPYHPHPSAWTTWSNNARITFWCNGNNPNNTAPVYLSTVDYPNIEPGGPLLPSSVSWYITIGNNPNYNLETGTEFIDVWKIMTVSGGSWTSSGGANSWTAGGGNTTSSSEFTSTCDNFLESPSSSISISDSTENNSDLDINNISLTYIDDKTVKITIPFKTDLSIDRLNSILITRQSKIFFNIYPTEI